MCFGDQATLPINIGHNTHKKGKQLTRGQFCIFERQKKKKNSNLKPISSFGRPPL